MSLDILTLCDLETMIKAKAPFSSNDLHLHFIFVPHGASLPHGWVAAHPGWVTFPATFRPRSGAQTLTAVMPSMAEAEALPMEQIADQSPAPAMPPSSARPAQSGHAADPGPNDTVVVHGGDGYFKW
jgi:hypothetical protein